MSSSTTCQCDTCAATGGDGIRYVSIDEARRLGTSALARWRPPAADTNLSLRHVPARRVASPSLSVRPTAPARRPPRLPTCLCGGIYFVSFGPFRKCHRCGTTYRTG